jgi:pSer/pThr/pTyr-binding forkhead associated (FHA) protein/pimeloyl-ACP methyl ester carboxylesterase
MHRSGIFLIQVDAVGEQPSQSSSLLLEWLDGEPYATALSGGSDARRNDAIMQPGVPVALRRGDTLTIGRTHLIWQEADNQSARESVPLARKEAWAEGLEPGYSVSINSPQGRREIALTDGDYRIGRAPDNDIFIDDEHISRYHAQLIRRTQGYEIVDLGSVNGLRHDNTRIIRRTLADGDVVWLSSAVSLTYRDGQQTSAATSLTDELDGAGVQPAGVGPISSEADVDRSPQESAEATVVRRVPTDPVPVSEQLDVGKPEHGRDAESDRTVILEGGAATRSGKTDETVVRASDGAASYSGLEETRGPARDTADGATAVMPQPQDQPEIDAASEMTVVAPHKAVDRTGRTQEDSGSGDDAVGLVGELGADQPSDPAIGSLDATVVRPALPIPEQPVGLREITPEPNESSRAPTKEGETAVVDMAEFAGDTSIALVSGTIIRDTQVPHLVVHLPTRTWEVQFIEDHMTVGRDINSDVHIPDESVSRQHAVIERHGDDYVIREKQSRNGLWFNHQHIEKRKLRDGDVVSVGRAKLMFKGGFSADDLTLVGRPRADGTPVRRPVVFVPGFGGSELWLGSECLWPNPKHIISNPEIFQLPGDPRIEARRIVSDVVIVPGVIKQQQYSRLGDYLEQGLGYKRGRDLLEFAYDWRQDVRLASQRLAETIESWGVQPPVTVIAHSLGTLVTRYYVERLGGRKMVDRTILLGGPHYGAPKGLSLILTGPGILPFGMGDERMRHVVSSFPSSYQILPVYPCITDQNDQYIDPLRDESWLPERQRPFLRAARAFRSELGIQASVPSVSIFGYGLKTMLRVKIHRQADGLWEKVDFIDDTAGDMSVPSGSAVLKNSEIHPVLQEHGSLYVDDDVKMRLKVELTRSTTWEKGR